MTRRKQWLCWFFFLLTFIIVWMNVMILRQHNFLAAPMERYSERLRKEFTNESSSLRFYDESNTRQAGSYWGYYMERGAGDAASEGNNRSSSRFVSDYYKQHHYPRSRTLVGIISADTRNDCTYRRRHRELFQIWNDTRVCSLAELKAKTPPEQKRCQLVYTFVIGAATADDEDDIADPKTKKMKKDRYTQIVDSSIPLYRSSPLISKFPDINQDDVTLLNIKENMNDGKSPTFFYFASTILEEYHLDYAMKLDGDSILHLHDWFLFAHYHLPPSPYNRGFMGGALRHKAFWPAPSTTTNNTTNLDHVARLPPVEDYWEKEYDGIHLYLAGQCYFMSWDLCKVVAEEAPKAADYLEGHEDHDTSSMAFHSPNPIHLLTIGKSQRFWEHPVKGQPRWDRIRKREVARVAGDVFEHKKLLLYLDE